MYAAISRKLKHVITLAGAALFAGSSILMQAGPASAFDNDNDYGLSSCILYDGERLGSNICCWEEPADENGDSLGICIQCRDENMSDCDVIDDPRGISAPRGNITTVPKASGTLEIKPKPKIKLNRPRNGEVLR